MRKNLEMQQSVNKSIKEKMNQLFWLLTNNFCHLSRKKCQTLTGCSFSNVKIWFSFWTVGQIKQDIWIHFFGLWEIITSICHYFLAFHRPNDSIIQILIRWIHNQISINFLCAASFESLYINMCVPVYKCVSITCLVWVELL